VRYSFLILVIAISAVTVWKIHAASVEQRADSLLRFSDEACRRFDFKCAHAHLASYLRLKPRDADAHLLAARCARRAQFLEDYAGPDPELTEMVSSHLRDAERLGASSEAIALERTLASIQHGSWYDGERVLVARVKQVTSDTPLILEGLIHGYLRRFNFEKALVCEEALLRMEPGNVLGFLWRGRMRTNFRQKAEARADYEAALNLLSDFDAARYYLAETYMNANQLGEAESHLKILIEHDPKNLLVRLLWARCRIALGDDVVGRELVDAWLEDAPPHHLHLLDALDAGSRAALSSAQPEKAEEYARRALRESPKDQHALYDVVRSLNAQGRRDEARVFEAELDKVKKDLAIASQLWDRLAKEPTNLQLRHEIGDTYLRLGRTGDALIWLNSILDRDPENKPTLQSLADYHAQAGHEAVAAEMRQRLAACP
jgi:tetratricopeptide (TPR) repeat protein